MYRFLLFKMKVLTNQAVTMSSDVSMPLSTVFVNTHHRLITKQHVYINQRMESTTITLRYIKH